MTVIRSAVSKFQGRVHSLVVTGDIPGKVPAQFLQGVEVPHIQKRVCFIALIDDASRFIVAADLFFNDSFENLMTVIPIMDGGTDARGKKLHLVIPVAGTVVKCEKAGTNTKSITAMQGRSCACGIPRTWRRFLSWSLPES